MAFNRTPGNMRIRVTTGPEWKRVEETLRVLNETLADQFKRELRDAADSLADKTRKAVLEIPVHGGKHTGLRGRVGKGVGVKLTGAGVSISSSMDRASERNIPAYLDARDGWRHPVFGNRHAWVRQTTGGAWFTDVLEHGQPEVEEKLTGVFEKAAHEIAAAGAGR
jgi:hypothetical protein